MVWRAWDRTGVILGDGRDMWRRGEDGVERVMRYRTDGKEERPKKVTQKNRLTFILSSCRR